MVADHDEIDLNPGFSKTQLLKLARWNMPYGKYAGRVLLDLPEAYLLWFAERGFPEGELGELLQLCLQLKIDGSEALLQRLKLNSNESL